MGRHQHRSSSSHLYSQQQNAYPNTPAPMPANMATTTTSHHHPGEHHASSRRDFPTGADVIEENKDAHGGGYLPNVSGAWIDVTGRPLTLRMVVDTGDGWAADTGELLAQQLGQAGIRVAVTSEPNADAAGFDLFEGKADLALIPLDASPYTGETSAWYTPRTGTAGHHRRPGLERIRLHQGRHPLLPGGDRARPSHCPAALQPDRSSSCGRTWWRCRCSQSRAPWPGPIDTMGVAADPYAPGLLSTLLDWARLVSEPANYSGTPTIPAS